MADIPSDPTARTPKARVPLTTEIGVSGLNYFYPGYVREEFLPELYGKQAINIYTQMGSNDPVVAGMLFVVEMLFRSVEWYVQKAGEDSQDVEAAEFLESCMNDMQNSWSNLLGEVSSEFQFGHAAFEIVYKRRNGEKADYAVSSKYDDGLVGWNKISIRSQNTIQYWQFDEDGALRGLWQLSPPRYQLVFIPIEKILLFRTKSTKGNPEGKSILRASYRPWFIKKTLEDIRNIGLERGVAGIPRFWLPPDIAAPNPDDPNYDACVAARLSWIETGKSIRSDSQSCIIIPLCYNEKGDKLYDMDLMTTATEGAGGISEVIKEKSVEILQSCLAEFIMLGVANGGVGSYALSQDKTAMFLKSLGTYLAGVEDTINRHAVPRLFKLNPKFAVKKYPEIKHKPLRDVDLRTVAQLLTTMRGAGAMLFPDLDLENFIREAAGLPPKSEEQAKAEEEERAKLKAQLRAPANAPGQAAHQEQPPAKAPAKEGATELQKPSEEESESKIGKEQS